MNVTYMRDWAQKSEKVFSSLRPAVKGLTKKLVPNFRGFLAFAYIASFIIAAQIVLRVDSLVGVYVNAAALAALVALALVKSKFRSLAISVAILPVANMISLTLPRSNVFSQTVVFYDVMLVLALVYRYLFTIDQPLEYTRLKLRNYLSALPVMVFLGEVLGVIGYGMLRYHYPFGHTSLPLVATGVVVFAFAEESLFRGLIQQKAIKIMSPMLAIALPAILFAFMTIGHFTLLAPVFALVLGTTLSLTYYFKHNLILTSTINLLSKLTYVGLLATFVFR